MINEKRLVDHFLELCRVNTPARKERVLVDIVQPQLEALGLTCVRDEAHLKTGGDCGNLICTLSATRDGVPAIFFSSHFDTVEPTPNLNVVIKDGIIRSDGSTILGADDKGGMAPIIEAIRVIQENNIPHGEIQLLLTVSEEVGLLGAHHIDQSLVTARQGFVLDTGPPVGTVVFTAPTQDALDITINGKPAHAGFEPEKGISAIQVAAHAIDRMKQGRLDFETTCNVGIIHGGSATNIVCPQVKLRAEARSRNPEKLQAQVDHMTQTFQQSAREFGADVDIAVRRQYDTYRLTEDENVIRWCQSAAHKLGLPTGLLEAGGGSDANVFNKFGWPTCVLATGMKEIHTHQEHIAIAELVRSAEWVVQIVREVALEVHLKSNVEVKSEVD